MKKIVALFAALFMALAMLGTAPASAEPKNHWYCGPEDGDHIVNVHDKKLQVIVQEGASCTIENSTVKTVRAVNTAHDVNVWDTEVVRGVHVMGATGTVHIGVKNCKYDPPVGNNVKVTKSHNVLICWVTTKNNIEVTGNDGRVTVRDSNAGNNLKVTRNKKYVSDGTDTDHRHPEWVRVLRNTYDNNLFTVNKARPKTVVRGNKQV